VPFSGTSLAQKPLQQGVNGQQMGTIAGIAFLMKKKTMGCDCQHFFFCAYVASPADSVPIYKLSTATQNSLFGLGFVLGSSSYRLSITSIRCQF
jgi:hypothetical protein